MKKIGKIILAILLFTISITTVCAKIDDFELDWKKEISSQSTNIEEVAFSDKVEYKDGYIVSKLITENEKISTKIVYYNYKGEVIKEKTLQNEGIMALREYEGNLYAISLIIPEKDSASPESYKLLKLNDNFEIEKEQNITLDEQGIIFMLPMLVKFINLDFISTVNDKITVVGGEGSTIILYHFDKDLNNAETEPITNSEEDMKKVNSYYPIVSEVLTLREKFADNPKDKMTILSDSKNNKKVYNGLDLSECEMLGNNTKPDLENIPPCYFNSVLKLTSDDNVVFDKIYNDYLALINAQIVGDYIVALGVTNIGNFSDIIKDFLENFTKFPTIDLGDFKTEVVIFDMSGEIVGTLSDKNSFYLGIKPTKRGFAVNKLELDRSLSSIMNSISDDSLPNFNYNFETYNLLRNINVKVSGKGSVVVANKIITGETVEFKINPEKGYVLGAVKITDANGNVIETKENTFVMPSSNVAIEVTFIPNNPETKDMAIIGIAIALLIGFGLTCFNYKKISTLR